MSQLIAPGKWDATKRVAAKAAAPFVGFGLICVSAFLFYQVVVSAAIAGNDPNWIVALISMVPGALGMVAVFPDIVTPVLYRVIDKWGRDTE